MGAYGNIECPTCKESYYELDGHRCDTEYIAERLTELQEELELKDKKIKELEMGRESMLACLNEAKERVDELWEVYKKSVIIEGLDYWTSKTRTQAKGG